MAFMFGRGRRASRSTAPYMGMELGVSGTSLHQGYIGGYSPLQQSGNRRGLSRMPMEHTPERQYRDAPIGQRPITSRADYGRVLETKESIRQAKLAAADPGLSTRGSMPISGTRNRPAVGPKGGLGGPIDELGLFNREDGMILGRRPMKQDLPGRRIDTSHRAAEMDERMSRLLAIRKEAKLASADPGLSSRGVVPAHGARVRPMSAPPGGARRGLESRGVRPAAGARVRPMSAPPGGAKRGLESRGVRPAAGTRVLPSQNLPVHVPGQGYGTTASARSGMRGRVASGPSVGPSGRAIPMGPGPNRRALVPRRSSSGGSGLLPDVLRNTPPPGPVQESLNATPTPKKFGKGMMIGLGAAVIAGLAYSGRRGEGSSGGRTSQYQY